MTRCFLPGRKLLGLTPELTVKVRRVQPTSDVTEWMKVIDNLGRAVAAESDFSGPDWVSQVL